MAATESGITGAVPAASMPAANHHPPLEMKALSVVVSLVAPLRIPRLDEQPKIVDCPAPPRQHRSAMSLATRFWRPYLIFPNPPERLRQDLLRMPVAAPTDQLPDVNQDLEPVPRPPAASDVDETQVLNPASLRWTRTTRNLSSIRIAKRDPLERQNEPSRHQTESPQLFWSVAQLTMVEIYESKRLLPIQ